MNENEPMDRRGFVLSCALAGAGLVLTGCVPMVTHPVPVSGGRVRLPLASYPELGKPDGAIRILPEASSDPIYVLAAANGEFRAVSPICTHRGCTVDVQGERLVCPCHGSTYDREGRVLRGPAERALASYTVIREGDTLLVSLEVR
ncbi:MAG: ubiquinol-cytochrome c reductase iron-sulfur subunit [Gemmatimonadaceae bacterium]